MSLVNVACLLAWFSIEWTHAIYQDQDIKGPLDPEWSEYIEKVDKELAEIEGRPLPPAVPATSFYPRIDWSLVGNGEAPYLAVIFKKTMPVNATLTPGNACGGALLTADKIITVCACLESWSTWIKQGGSLTKKSTTNPYDILSELIYVSYGRHLFIPTVPTTLSNEDKSLWAAIPCENISQLALVAKFKPRILHPIPQQYMPWPPVPVMETEETKHSKATAISFGMRARQPDKKFTTDIGDEIPIEMRAVNFNLKHERLVNAAKSSRDLKIIMNCLAPAIPTMKASNEVDIILHPKRKINPNKKMSPQKALFSSRNKRKYYLFFYHLLLLTTVFFASRLFEMKVPTPIPNYLKTFNSCSS